jgi:dTMP kinase
MTARGRFLTVEGIDGAGKSTHIGFVTQFLQSRGKTVVSSREPGGTALGEKLRELLLHEKMDLETEALLMFASRREHIAQVIEPALAAGSWVLSDRFTDASFAYQSGGRGMDRAKMEALEAWVHPHLQPDLTLLFSVRVASRRSRATSSASRERSLRAAGRSICAAPPSIRRALPSSIRRAASARRRGASPRPWKHCFDEFVVMRFTT